MLGLAILFAARVGRAQGLFHFKGPCDKLDYPVLVYDAQLRRTHIVPRNLVKNRALGHTIALQPDELERYLCDGTPVEMYIVNRKLKEVFNATITGVVSVPSAVVSIRGVSAGVTPPAAAPPAAAAAPAAKGGPTTAPLQVAMVVDQLLSAETFNVPEQTIREEAEQLRALARQQDAQIHQYLDKLNHLIEVPAGPPSGDTQGSATLVGTSNAFATVSAQVGAELTSADVPDIEPRFDRINARIGILVQDVQRLNTNVQSFPIVDQLNALQQQEETFEASVRQYRNDIQTAELASKILKDLIKQGSQDYLKQRNEAEIRRELQSQFPPPTTPNMDVASIASIAKSYADHSAAPFIRDELPGYLNALRGRLAEYAANLVPEASFLEPGAMRARFNAAAARLPVLRADIDLLNRTEAATFDAINSRYRDFRIPRAIPVYSEPDRQLRQPLCLLHAVGRRDVSALRDDERDAAAVPGVIAIRSKCCARSSSGPCNSGSGGRRSRDTGSGSRRSRIRDRCGKFAFANTRILRQFSGASFRSGDDLWRLRVQLTLEHLLLGDDSTLYDNLMPHHLCYFISRPRRLCDLTVFVDAGEGSGGRRRNLFQAPGYVPWRAKQVEERGGFAGGLGVSPQPVLRRPRV